jgi:hypothetical protein
MNYTQRVVQYTILYVFMNVNVFIYYLIFKEYQATLHFAQMKYRSNRFKQKLLLELPTILVFGNRRDENCNSQ